MIKYKVATIDTKADGSDLKEGEFIGYAAVFDNVDSYGDVIRKGAFDASLKSYGPGGEGIPCYWSHQMTDPYSNLGKSIYAREDDHGLMVKVQLDLSSAKAAYVHQLIKEGRVSQMSFAYDIEEAGFVEVDGREAYELRKLRIHEISVVPIGANQQTELLAVKSMESTLKSGDVQLTADQATRLDQAQSLVSGILDEVVSVGQETYDEEPREAKSEDPATGEDEERVEVKSRTGSPDSMLALIELAHLS